MFQNNKFYLPLKDYDLLIHQRILFQAFVVADRPENSKNTEGVGQAKLLGEQIFELGPISHLLTNINNMPVKQNLDFTRKKDDENIIVGRFSITLKLLAETLVPDEVMDQAINDTAHLLPEMDITRNFVWRLRVDVRSAVNLPFNRTTESKLPACYIEIGWTMYAMQDLNQSEAVRSSSVNANRFPIWNQQLLYYPPSSVSTIDGFINIFLKDRFQMNPMQKIIFPVNLLRPFHPVHLDFLLDNEDVDKRSHLYISLTLEDVS